MDLILEEGIDEEKDGVQDFIDIALNEAVQTPEQIVESVGRAQP